MAREIKEKAENVATEETVEAVKEEAVKEEATVADEWQDMREIMIPRGAAGEAKSVYVSINSRPAYMVPRGKKVMVPYPVYERLQIMLDAEDRMEELRDEIDRENKENMNSTISWSR